MVDEGRSRWAKWCGTVGCRRVLGTFAAAMIDRLVHPAELTALKGDSHRMKNPELGRVSAAVNEQNW